MPVSQKVVDIHSFLDIPLARSKALINLRAFKYLNDFVVSLLYEIVLIYSIYYMHTHHIYMYVRLFIYLCMLIAFVNKNQRSQIVTTEIAQLTKKRN